MRKTRLGRTNLIVTKNSFGALPIQRLSHDEAVSLLRKAFEGGITLFDSAHTYSDSEEKLGDAFHDVRDQIVLTTKTPATDAAGVRADTLESLRRLRTDYVDVMQFHNPSFVPMEDNEGYQEMKKLQQEGKIRFIGITCHRLQNAIDAVNSGLYDTVQYPLSCLSSPEELALIELAQSKDVGVLCMKAMCGGLLTSAAPSMSVLDAYEGAVPIFGVQRESELEEILSLDANPPRLDDEMKAYIAKERDALMGEFCRACGYCLPCPAQINIPTSARMMLLMNRSPWQQYVTPEGIAQMNKIDGCIGCNACKSRCPYHLDTPALLKRNLAYFRQFLKEKGIED